MKDRFGVRRSAFGVRHSVFGIRYSAKTRQPEPEGKARPDAEWWYAETIGVADPRTFTERVARMNEPRQSPWGFGGEAPETKG